MPGILLQLMTTDLKAKFLVTVMTWSPQPADMLGNTHTHTHWLRVNEVIFAALVRLSWLPPRCLPDHSQPTSRLRSVCVSVCMQYCVPACPSHSNCLYEYIKAYDSVCLLQIIRSIRSQQGPCVDQRSQPSGGSDRGHGSCVCSRKLHPGTKSLRELTLTTAMFLALFMQICRDS